MTTRMYINEIKRFLKENIKLILLLSIIGAGLFLGFRYVLLGTDTPEEVASSLESKTSDISTRYAQFMIYVEKNDDVPFLNNALVEKLLFTPDHIANVEQQVGIEVQPLLEMQELQEFPATPTNRGVIGFERDPVTDSLKFVTLIGSEEERLQTAQYFFNLIQSEEIEFLSDKRLTIVEEPHLHEYTPDELRKAEQASSALLAEGNSQMMLVIEVLLSIIVGLIVGVVLTVFYHIYTSKINYGFNYYVSDKDLFIIARDSVKEFVYAVIEPNAGKKLVVTQIEMPEGISKELNNSILQTHDTLTIAPEEEFLEVVLVVIEGKTDKEWYTKQLNYARRLNSNIKVIQTSNEIFASSN